MGSPFVVPAYDPVHPEAIAAAIAIDIAVRFGRQILFITILYTKSRAQVTGHVRLRLRRAWIPPLLLSSAKIPGAGGEVFPNTRHVSG
ncbi:hypothetical protein WK58_11615 [Burkholderia ubonensis]|nr:hypothetical protein WK58_11615 [Burkholderia ubonensis]